MKIICSAVFLLIAGSVAAYAAEPTVRDVSLEKLREAFSYAASESSPASTEAESSNAPKNIDVIRLERYVVRGSLQRLDLTRDIEHKSAVRAEKAFSLKKGGLIRTKTLGKLEIELGVWPSIAMSSSPNGMPMLSVDVFHLRW
jgi:hypothetical protein